MSTTAVILLIIVALLVGMVVMALVLAIFAVEVLRSLLRRTPLAPFVARGGGGNYGTAPDDGD